MQASAFFNDGYPAYHIRLMLFIVKISANGNRLFSVITDYMPCLTVRIVKFRFKALLCYKYFCSYLLCILTKLVIISVFNSCIIKSGC